MKRNDTDSIALKILIPANAMRRWDARQCGEWEGERLREHTEDFIIGVLFAALNYGIDETVGNAFADLNGRPLISLCGMDLVVTAGYRLQEQRDAAHTPSPLRETAGVKA